MKSRGKEPELGVLDFEAAVPLVDAPFSQQEALPACRQRLAGDGPFFEGESIRALHRASIIQIFYDTVDVPGGFDERV